MHTVTTVVSPPKFSLPAPTAPTDSPIAAHLKFLNLNSSEQPANDAAKVVQESIITALSSQKTTPAEMAIILKNAFNEGRPDGYVKQINNFIAQIKTQDPTAKIPINDDVIDILRRDNIALTLNSKQAEKDNGLIAMRQLRSSKCFDQERAAFIESTLSFLPAEVIKRINAEDNHIVFPKGFPVDSQGEIDFSLKNNKIFEDTLAQDCTDSPNLLGLKREIILQAIAQRKKYLLGQFNQALFKATGATKKTMDLRGINLSGLNLSDVDFSSADLSGANLKGANLERAKLKGTTLTGANMTASKLVSADMRYSHLEHAILTCANLHKADLAFVRMDHARLNHANLTNAWFSAASINFAKLVGANISQTVFGSCFKAPTSLEGADLSHVTAKGTNFSTAILKRATFREATVDGANFERTDLSQSKLIRSKFKDSPIHNANLTEMTIDQSTVSTLPFLSRSYLHVRGESMKVEQLAAPSKQPALTMPGTSSTDVFAKKAEAGKSERTEVSSRFGDL